MKSKNIPLDQITDEEKGILGIVRLNKIFPRKGIVKVWKIRRLRVKFEWNSKHNLWGRFGGGWNWELGIQIGRTTVIVNILVFSVRFDIESKKGASDEK
jgi:hypothetical protein